MPSSQILFEGNVDIVPMPGWLSFIGVSRFLIAFVTIALVTATTPIWGSFTAFGLSLFTVSLTCAQRLRHTDDLPACGDPLYRGYYRLALGYKPLLYHPLGHPGAGNIRCHLLARVLGTSCQMDGDVQQLHLLGQDLPLLLDLQRRS